MITADARLAEQMSSYIAQVSLYNERAIERWMLSGMDGTLWKSSDGFVFVDLSTGKSGEFVIECRVNVAGKPSGADQP